MHKDKLSIFVIIDSNIVLFCSMSRSMYMLLCKLVVNLSIDEWDESRKPYSIVFSWSPLGKDLRAPPNEGYSKNTLN